MILLLKTCRAILDVQFVQEHTVEGTGIKQLLNASIIRFKIIDIMLSNNLLANLVFYL